LHDPEPPITSAFPPPPAASHAAAPDAFDELLASLVGGWFVLVDGSGRISKWSEPAELLFGRPPAEALGAHFFRAVCAGPMDEAAARWRGWLDGGPHPGASGVARVRGRHAPTAATVPLQLVFVPVSIEDGFDFSLFLEDLASAPPAGRLLLRMHRHHPVVVAALRAALDEDPTGWDGTRTAGTLIAIRPLGPTPWIAAELERRRAEAARREAEVQAATAAPAIRGRLGDLDDAAVVVERMIAAVSRIDALEVAGDGVRERLRRVEDAERGRAAAFELRSQAAARQTEALAATVEALRAEVAALRTLVEAAPQPPATVPGGGPPGTRPPRPGFDDDPAPLARLDPDGRFRELNPSFCRLVGYDEHAFAKAAWPSPHDRNLFAMQEEQLADLVSGREDEIDVRSTYMHGQGLMVRVIGSLTAVRDAAGATTHLLLRAEERERTG
jgi:PAS domain-containing protein